MYETAKRVAEARHKKNLTQVQLAEKVNVGKSMIAQIERGSKSISSPLLGILATALEVTTDWLIYGDKTA